MVCFEPIGLRWTLMMCQGGRHHSDVRPLSGTPHPMLLIPTQQWHVTHGVKCGYTGSVHGSPWHWNWEDANPVRTYKSLLMSSTPAALVQLERTELLKQNSEVHEYAADAIRHILLLETCQRLLLVRDVQQASTRYQRSIAEQLPMVACDHYRTPTHLNRLGVIPEPEHGAFNEPWLIGTILFIKNCIFFLQQCEKVEDLSDSLQKLVEDKCKFVKQLL